MEEKYYSILYMDGAALRQNGLMFNTFEQLSLDFPGWLILDPDAMPEDFSVVDYTIENGQLVKASAVLIAERDAKAKAAYNEQQRQLREVEYRALADPITLELIADANPAIVAIKNEIRDKYPYQE